MLVCSLVFALGIAFTANATPLTDAVDEYNVVASRLPSYWNTYQDDQDAAFDDFQLMIDSLAYYIMEDDIDDALAYWDDYVDARDDLETSSATLDNSFFTVFVTTLEDAAEKLQDVVDLDELSETEVAYVDGSPHFSLPATPFVFWKDEGEPPFDEFMEFEFPHLSVGDPASYSSYESETLGGFIGSISEIWDLIKLLPWFNKHKDTGSNINSSRADDWDALCEWCLCVLVIEETPPPEGYTREEAIAFCDEYSYSHGGNGWCEDENLSDREKGFWIRKVLPAKQQEDIDRGPVKAIEDYLMIAWYWEFPFPIST